MKLCVWVLATLVQCIIAANDRSHVHTVETKLGTIAGYINTVDLFGTSKEVVRFLGVPYAVPPVGPRRLQKSELLTRLPETPYDATYLRPSCMQLYFKEGQKIPTSEDCLYLNIFSPAVQPTTTEKRAVMIYFHGGLFVLGSGAIYYGDNLAAFGDVIVVTVNYRLGVLGFFSTGDKHAPGNYGLWDQHTAIQWVHENIEAFGGDPDKVTLFGGSAGSASCIYQAMYPGNEGLFKRAIGQSGGISAAWARTKDPLKAARVLGKLLNCDSDSNFALAECIKRKPLSDIDRVYNDPSNGFAKFPADFTPSVDGEFVLAFPDDILLERNKEAFPEHKYFSSIDFMTGFNSLEGGFSLTKYGGWDIEAEHLLVSRDSFENTWVPKILNYAYGQDVPKVIRDVVAAEYTNWTQIDDGNVRNWVLDLCADYTYGIPTIHSVKFRADIATKGKTYLYFLDFQPSLTMYFPKLSWASGAHHCDELYLVFGYNKDLVKPFATFFPVPEWEANLSKAVMTMWTNFAKTGNPNGPANVKQYMDVDWPAYSADTESYLHLRQGQSYVGQRLKARATHFWLTTMPSLLETVCKTCPADGPVKNQAETGNVCFKDGTCDP